MKKLTLILMLILFQTIFPATLRQVAEGMSPGTWAEVPTTGFTWENVHKSCGYSGGCGNIFAYSDDATWYPKTETMFFLGKGHKSNNMRFQTLPGNTCTWLELPYPTWIPTSQNGHAYDNNAMDEENGVFYHHLTAGYRVAKYDIATRMWSPLPNLPSDAKIGYGEAMAYFPELNGLIRIKTGFVHYYNKATNQWTLLGDRLVMAHYHNVAKYVRAARVVIFGGGNGSQDLYKIDGSGKITRIADPPLPVAINSTVLSSDPSSSTLLLVDNSKMWGYNVNTDTWSSLGSTPFTYTSGADRVVATPVSSYGVTMFIQGYNGSNGKVWLYKHSTSAVTRLDTRSMYRPSIHVSPNPFNNRTTFEFNVHPSTALGISMFKVQIFNPLGKTVHQFSNENDTYIWNAGNNLPAGIYVVKADLGKRTLSRKVILQK